jgi:hypothetical protein
LLIGRLPIDGLWIVDWTGYFRATSARFAQLLFWRSFSFVVRFQEYPAPATYPPITNRQSVNPQSPIGNP